MWFLYLKGPRLNTQLVLEVVAGDKPTKTGFENSIGHALELECSTELLDNEKQNVSNP